MRRASFPMLLETRKTLGHLELEAMRMIWSKEKCTVRDVMENLSKKKLLAYTTVMTVMDNLYKKGFVTRIKIKKTYHYTPIAAETLFIRSSISRMFRSLMSEYGKLTVLSSLISLQINLPLPKLNQTFIIYKTPVTVGFLASFVLGLFVISFWDLLQGLTFLGSADYLRLVISEPKIIFDHTNLIFSAFFESLPMVSLFTNVVLLIFSIFVIRKITKLLHVRFPLFFRMGGFV